MRRLRNSKIFISNQIKLSITPPTNRVKLESFYKTNAGNPHKYRFSAFLSVIQTPLCKVVMWCFLLILMVALREFCLISTCCVSFREIVLSFCCHYFLITYLDMYFYISTFDIFISSFFTLGYFLSASSTIFRSFLFPSNSNTPAKLSFN